MRNLIKYTEGFYVYGLPLLLLTLFLSFFGFPKFILDILGTLIVIFFCLRELRVSFVSRKCKWHKASVIGVLLFCIVDLAFYGNYDSYIYEYVQLYVLALSITSVIYFYFSEYGR